jgi:hypothetical protein
VSGPTGPAFPVAAVILAHHDPAMTERLVEALHPMEVFLHVDRRVQIGPWAGLVGRDEPARLHLTPRYRCALDSWTLVQAELAALDMAYETSPAGHFLVLSGSDYPLAPVEAIATELEQWRDLSRVVKIPIPFEFWGADGGMRRFARRWVTLGHNSVKVRGRNLYYPGRRSIPPELSLQASQEWKILARPHVAALLDACRRRPDLVRWWMSTLVPDESMIVSMLSSPAIVGPDVAAAVIHGLPWLIEWDAADPDHPKVLTMDDWDLIHRAARIWPLDDPRDAERPVRLERRRMFARKFRSADKDLLDRIDAELRS